MSFCWLWIIYLSVYWSYKAHVRDFVSPYFSWATNDLFNFVEQVCEVAWKTIKGGMIRAGEKKNFAMKNQ